MNLTEQRTIRRDSSTRLSRSQWGAGRAIQDADAEGTTADRVAVDEVPGPPHVAAALRLNPGVPVIRRTRRYVSASGRPLQLATSWTDADLTRHSPIAMPDTGPGGSLARLAEMGLAAVRFTEEVVGRMPTPAEREALELGEGQPVQAIARVAVTPAGRPAEFTEIVLDASAYVLAYEVPA
jgi:GntR family transcriptional regulator